MQAIMNDGNSYIVKHKEEFYLVNLDTRTAMKANPPNSPDMFLRFLPYAEDTEELPAELEQELFMILNASL